MTTQTQTQTQTHGLRRPRGIAAAGLAVATLAVLAVTAPAAIPSGPASPAPTPAPAPAPAETLSPESAAATDARGLLHNRFIEIETRRYLVFSDADPAWTRQQADYLELAYQQFVRTSRRLGLSPRPLRHKLVAVAFRNRADYQRFAAEHDDVADPALAGYYSPRAERVVFYHVESNPSLTEARTQLDEMRQEIRDIEREARDALRQGDGDQAHALRELRTRYQQHLRVQRQRVESFAVQAGTATIVHEAVHQLAFHTEVQTPEVEYPLWISEGLATSFETDAPDRPFGPAEAYRPRREQFDVLIESDRLMPLRDLVRLTHHHSDPDVRAVVYPQSYAFFTWIARHRREALQNYLASMRNEPPGRPTSTRHLELFVESFGDADAIERAWLKYERAARPG